MLNTKISKLQAFSIHLAISLFIFLVVLYFIVFHWYPLPFFSSDGGWQGIRIIASVDIVLGPLLTLIVYKPGKPSLKFDLSVIALVQIVALVFGVKFVYQERAVAVIWAQDRFHTVPSYLWEAGGAQLDELKLYGEKLPVRVYMDLPDTPAQMSEIFNKALIDQKNLYQLSEYYRVFDEPARRKLKQSSIDMETYLKDRPDDLARYHRYLETAPGDADVAYLPLHLRYGYKIAVVDVDAMKFVSALDILPPTYNPAIHGAPD